MVVPIKKFPTQFWFYLSLSVAALCGILGLLTAFSSPYTVQDDARSHVFWMFRFLDPDLFPNDVIANYFQSVAPQGYTLFYRILITIGFHPLLLHKLLPIALGLITTAYGFWTCLEILPSPVAGFSAMLLLNQNLWLKDDLVSATPRAFFYPIFLAFLYYLLRRSHLGISLTIAGLGLFYPQGVLIAGAVLMVSLLQIPFRKTEAKLLYSGLITALLILLPYVLTPSEFGAVISAHDAKQLPEFWPGGRASFFTNNPWDFWLTGDRSGLFPREWFSQGFIPPQLWAGCLLPILFNFPDRFPFVKQVTQRIYILPQLACATTLIFFAAHLFAFKLHHPSRYTQHSFRILMAMAGGIAIGILVDPILQHFKTRSLPFTLKLLGLSLLSLILIYPSLSAAFPVTNYIVGKAPTLYEFLSQQPKKSLIASLSVEANNLPTFAKRSILVGSEYALPYHQKYYAEFHQKSGDLIQAQYSANPLQVQTFIQNYGINFWLLDREALTRNYVQKNHRLRQLHSEATAVVQANLEKGTVPILSKVTDACTVWKNQDLILLQANCIVETMGQQSNLNF